MPDFWAEIVDFRSGSWRSPCSSWSCLGRTGAPEAHRGELMRVLVTGHNGYIGSVMVVVLMRAGHDIVGLDTYLFEDCTLGAERAQVPSIRADIRDLDAS